MSVGSLYWRTRLARWPRRARAAAATSGYALLVPVPGDLPVFLDLALTVLSTQTAEHRVTTLVIPDQATPSIREIVAARRARWVGPLELLELPLPERYLLPRLKSASRNHGMQLVTGINAAGASHIVLHDADLFLLESGALDDQFRRCRDEGLSCLGVSPVWDTWFAEHGLALTATWELCAEVEWLRSFAPHLHLGHDAELFGEIHTFDTTLEPQARTDPALIAWHDLGESVVHFNYVISTYRLYQHRGPAMVDDNFRLLLIRVLIDLFASDDGAHQLPTLAEMTDVLRGGAALRFPTRADGAANYRTFRSHLERVLTGPWSSDSQRVAMHGALAEFDAYYDWVPEAVRP